LSNKSFREWVRKVIGSNHLIEEYNGNLGDGLIVRSISDKELTRIKSELGNIEFIESSSNSVADYKLSGIISGLKTTAFVFVYGNKYNEVVFIL
jgi:hypothetical protein